MEDLKLSAKAQKGWTEVRTLTVMMRTPKTVIHMATFKSGLQYWRIKPVAVKFVGVATMYLRK
jgi:hypothetical protein